MYQNALLHAQNIDVPDSLFASDVQSNLDAKRSSELDVTHIQMPSLRPDALSSQILFRARCALGLDAHQGQILKTSDT